MHETIGTCADGGCPMCEPPPERWEYKMLGKWEAVLAYGDAGWELVGIMRDPTVFDTGVTYYMKRKVR